MMTYETQGNLPELMDRMVPLFVQKLRDMPGFIPLSDEWWKVVVGTCIADTSIALNHPEYIDRWEKSLKDKPISPPGSGLDALQADIDRTDA